MPNQVKIERVAELTARIGAADSILLAEYRGLTVTDISELRRSLAEGGASFAVVKNTLMRRAAEESAMGELDSLLEGPTAVTFVQGDAVAAAKKLVEAIRRYPALVLKGGYMEGRLLSAADARALADLDSREAMLSKIAGLAKSEMSRAASMFQSAQSKFVSLMQAYAEKLPGDAAASDGAPPATDVAAPTDEAEAAATDDSAAPDQAAPTDASSDDVPGDAGAPDDVATDAPDATAPDAVTDARTDAVPAVEEEE